MQAIEDTELKLEDEIAPEEGDFEALPGEPAVYEIGYHLLPSLEETEISEVTSAIRASIEKKGGTVLAEDAPKKILLAYPVEKRISGKIERFIQANFGWLKVEILPSEMPEIHTALHTNARVLRFLISRTVKEDTLLAGRQFIRSEMKDKEKEKKAVAGVGGTEAEAEKAPLSEEELDRSLEKLIA